jgi:hypothetical protein
MLTAATHAAIRVARRKPYALIGAVGSVLLFSAYLIQLIPEGVFTVGLRVMLVPFMSQFGLEARQYRHSHEPRWFTNPQVVFLIAFVVTFIIVVFLTVRN